jgi:hypothetical protein
MSYLNYNLLLNGCLWFISTNIILSMHISIYLVKYMYKQLISVDSPLNSRFISIYNSKIKTKFIISITKASVK